MKPTENGQGGRQAKAADHEATRARYHPEKVRLLFVGESPPASGRFFYNRDSGLYRAMLGAFHAMDHTISDDNFLDVFKRQAVT
jgi:uracil-DNA glycosylase